MRGNAWDDLIEGLTILKQGADNQVSPLHCEHDELTVCATPEEFSPDEIKRLKDLGFYIDDCCFKSIRFGSA